MVPQVNAEEWREAIAHNTGWCDTCEEWRGEGLVPPEASRLICPFCGEARLYGADEAATLCLIIPN